MRLLLVVLIAVVAVTGCERLDPPAVGIGVARLSVRNAAVLTAIAGEDTTCGFKSAAVLASARVDGQAGGEGAVTWTVENCTLDLGELHVLATDCRGVETSVGGKVTISGTRTVEGVLTGDPASPVVPNKSKAVTIRQTVDATNFAVKRSDSTSALTIESGKFSWTARPPLAIATATEMCTITTNELTLSELTWEAAKVQVQSGERNFSVDIDSSSLSAQMGVGPDGENTLDGALSLWGTRVTIPTEKDKQGLDPTYDPGLFVESYACKNDLKQPISRACPSLTDRLAQGASSLSVSVFGTLASAIDEDTRCGFASPASLASARATGQVGGLGDVTFTITGCQMTWAMPTALKTDCFGNSRLIQGQVTASGTKTVRGRLTGDPAAPVIPNVRDAASVTLSMGFDTLTATESNTTRGLIITSGTLRGTLGSRLGVDTTSGACSIKTPVVFFRDLEWSDARLTVISGASRYPLHATASSLDAQSGAREDHENWLEGSLTLGGKAFTIPTGGGAPVLDPTYEAARYVESFVCMPNLRIAATDADCSFEETLARNTARLVIQTAGAVASMINKDTSCGFDNTLNKLSPSEVLGDPPMQGSMTWRVDGCVLNPGSNALLDRNCSGGERRASGEANVTGTRKVIGERETQLLIIDAIIPQQHDAVTLNLNYIALREFAAWSLAPQTTMPAGKLTIHAGSLAVQMQPILGERTSEPGRYDVVTPVAKFDSVVLTGAEATLQAGAKTFTLQLPRVQLNAQAGTFRGQSNVVRGTVQIGQNTIDIGTLPLDPSFMQQSFDQSYACTMDLRGVVNQP